MPDREKVIKGLKCCSQMSGYVCQKCPYSSECVAGETTYQTGTAHLAADALALLKEQPDIVRCKECKYYSDGFCYNPNTFDDEKTCGNTVPDWYCADGKRR